MAARVLLTGAGGFVGSAVMARMALVGRYSCVAAVRRLQPEASFATADVVAVGNLAADTSWAVALDGVEAVIHTAARVHVMNDTAADPLAAFRSVNVEGTLKLAREAAAAGVRRFIFISSIKVNGEGTAVGIPYTGNDKPAPVDPYGISKREAEEHLCALAAESRMEVVIIRPPLVYGPGVKGNFLSMMNLLSKGFPLPLGSIHNRRSLVALDNLVDLIVTCIDHPEAANQTFLVSDDEDLSTTELVQRMSQALGKQPYLLPVPAWMLETAAKALGKQAIAQRLCGSLQVDIAHTRERLGWTPPVRVDSALGKTALHFLKQQKQ